MTYELTYYSPKQVQEKVQNDALAAYVEDPGVSGYGGLIFSEIIGFIVDKIQSESTQPVGTIIEIAAIIAHFIGKGKESIDASKARFWVNAAQSGKGIIEVHYSAYGTSGSYCILWDETSEELGFGAYPMARR